MTPATDARPDGAPAGASRHRARQVALQMLYQWEVGRADMADVRRSRPAEPDAPLPDALQAFAERLAEGTAQSIATIDPLISEAASSWRIERMNVVDRLILRLAVHEFLDQKETPANVIINEALELARSFSSDDAVAFVNGVLDAIRRKLERA
jgi:N utilization substance protein B